LPRGGRSALSVGGGRVGGLDERALLVSKGYSSLAMHISTPMERIVYSSISPSPSLLRHSSSRTLRGAVSSPGHRMSPSPHHCLLTAAELAPIRVILLARYMDRSSAGRTRQVVFDISPPMMALLDQSPRFAANEQQTSTGWLYHSLWCWSQDAHAGGDLRARTLLCVRICKLTQVEYKERSDAHRWWLEYIYECGDAGALFHGSGAQKTPRI